MPSFRRLLLEMIESLVGLWTLHLRGCWGEVACQGMMNSWNQGREHFFKATDDRVGFAMFSLISGFRSRDFGCCC